MIKCHDVLLVNIKKSPIGPESIAVSTRSVRWLFQTFVAHIAEFDALVDFNFLYVRDHFWVHGKISDSAHTNCGASIHILYNHSSARFSNSFLIESHLQFVIGGVRLT